MENSIFYFTLQIFLQKYFSISDVESGIYLEFTQQFFSRSKNISKYNILNANAILLFIII